MLIGRRSFLTGLLAAPIIVRPGILMPVKPLAAAGFDTATMQFTSVERPLRWMWIYGLDVFGNPISERVDLRKLGLERIEPPISFKSVSSVHCTS